MSALSQTPGTGPAGPSLTPEEWGAVAEILHRAAPGTLVDPIERVRTKIEAYQTLRDYWAQDARRRKLANPL